MVSSAWGKTFLLAQMTLERYGLRGARPHRLRRGFVRMWPYILKYTLFAQATKLHPSD